MANPDTTNYEKSMILSQEWAWATNPANWDDEQELRRMVAVEGIEDSPRLKGYKNRMPIGIAPETILAGPGTLSALPLELMFQIIGSLDLNSAESFGQTSRLARFLLEQHPSYKPLMKTVPKLRVFYRNCGLDGWENLDNLAKELYHPYCRTCGHQGTSLFLPLSERVCYNCSTNSPAFWCIAVPEAMDAFCMSETQVRKLPILKVRERHWAVDPPNFPSTNLTNLPPIRTVGHQDLVPAKSAFLASIRIWGNLKTMCLYASSNDPDKYADATSNEQWLGAAYRFLRNMQIKAPDDPTQLDGPNLCMRPEFARITTVPFPWIPGGQSEIEQRFLCRGCEWLAQQPEISRTLLEYSGIDPTVSRKRLDIIIQGRRDTAHTWKGLIIHIRGCAGAGVLMYNHMVERDFENGLGDRAFWTWP